MMFLWERRAAWQEPRANVRPNRRIAARTRAPGL